jgi:AraC-like DNA-binding protein
LRKAHRTDIMLDNFTYTNLSLKGLLEAFSNFYNVPIKNNSLLLPKSVGEVSMQGLLLPGEIEVLFSQYDYYTDIVVTHKAEKEQKFVLWITLAEGDFQEFVLNNSTFITTEKEYSHAYLLNSVFSFSYLRKKNTKGKSIFIFIPQYLINSIGIENSSNELLGKYYALQCKGLSLIKLTDEEIKKVNSFFVQWENHKNIVSLSKYTFQLMEWYFTMLIGFLSKSDKIEKLTNEQATDLYSLQLLLDTVVHLHKPDFNNFEKSISTSLSKLKQLFVKMYGKTVYEYFNEKKMILSKEVLKNKDKNISEIAYDFGFSNPSNFSASFKRYYSFTPNEYRNQLKNIVTE